MDTFTRAYIACALWSSVPSGVCVCDHEADEHHAYDADNTQCKECGCTAYYEGDASFERLNYEIEDIEPDTLARMEADCRAFQEENEETFEAIFSECEWYSNEIAGHDYWLTRNGHGAGFWDRYYGVNAELRAAFKVLTDSAGYHPFNFYIGDDGKVYGS